MRKERRREEEERVGEEERQQARGDMAEVPFGVVKADCHARQQSVCGPGTCSAWRKPTGLLGLRRASPATCSALGKPTGLLDVRHADGVSSALGKPRL